MPPTASNPLQTDQAHADILDPRVEQGGFPSDFTGASGAYIARAQTEHGSTDTDAMRALDADADQATQDTEQVSLSLKAGVSYAEVERRVKPLIRKLVHADLNGEPVSWAETQVALREALQGVELNDAGWRLLMDEDNPGQALFGLLLELQREAEFNPNARAPEGTSSGTAFWTRGLNLTELARSINSEVSNLKDVKTPEELNAVVQRVRKALILFDPLYIVSQVDTELKNLPKEAEEDVEGAVAALAGFAEHQLDALHVLEQLYSGSPEEQAEVANAILENPSPLVLGALGNAMAHPEFDIGRSDLAVEMLALIAAEHGPSTEIGARALSLIQWGINNLSPQAAERIYGIVEAVDRQMGAGTIA